MCLLSKYHLLSHKTTESGTHLVGRKQIFRLPSTKFTKETQQTDRIKIEGEGKFKFVHRLKVERITFSQTEAMKLTFDLDITPADLAKAVRDGKASVKITAELLMDDKDDTSLKTAFEALTVEGSDDVSMVMAPAVLEGLDEMSIAMAPAVVANLKEGPHMDHKAKTIFSDQCIAGLRLSGIEELPYKLLQVNLKSRGVSAKGKHAALVSRLVLAAQTALQKTAIESIVDDSLQSEENEEPDPPVSKETNKKPILDFDDGDSFDEDYALSQDVYMIEALRDSLDNTSITK
jgi:hypothetical protein